jgi:hypothetical protein
MAEMAGVPGETPAQRAVRLAVQGAARVAAARQAIGEEYYSQFTFRPAINARSRRLAKVCDAVPPSNVLTQVAQCTKH